MAGENNVFDKLSTRLGAPGSVRFARILKAMMTSEEAEILWNVPALMTAAEIAEKMDTDVKTLQPKLDDMENRQVIRRVNDRYITPANIVGFHHGAIGWIHEDLKAKVYPLWDDFFFAEWRDMLVDGFIKRKEAGAPGAHRVVPAYRALRASPKVRPEQVLWYEDMEQVLKRSERISVMMCGCRGLWRKCDSLIETCLQVQFRTGENRVRPPTDFIKPPRDLTFKEAMTIIDECEDLGLVHIPLNTSQGDLFCNCCQDCCMVINPCVHRGKGVASKIISPSRYRAVVDQELCTGCQTCFKRCKFDAIEMVPVPGSKKQKSSIINANCLGCGVCVVKCPKQALTLELVRPPDHIPTVSSMELLRMGRIA